MARFCSSCGKELKETCVNYCEYCGATISSFKPSQAVGTDTTKPQDFDPNDLDQNRLRIISSLNKKQIFSSKHNLTALVIIFGIIIIAILFLTGLLSSFSLSSIFFDTGTQKEIPADDSVNLADANFYLNFPGLPENLVVLGQILGPIPGKKVEFVFEGGPNSNVFKSWRAVLIGPDGTLLDSKEGKIVKNDLITLQGKKVGTHTGLILATSYSGDTYRVLKREVLFRG
jgi:hypothetical protein